MLYAWREGLVFTSEQLDTEWEVGAPDPAEDRHRIH